MVGTPFPQKSLVFHQRQAFLFLGLMSDKYLVSLAFIIEYGVYIVSHKCAILEINRGLKTYHDI
jgi:hypothetical protein